MTAHATNSAKTAATVVSLLLGLGLTAPTATAGARDDAILRPKLEKLGAAGDTGATHGLKGTQETRHYPVGTKGNDIRDMLKAVREGTRAEIAVPKTFGNVTVDVTTRWIMEAADWDGDGHPDQVMLRTAVVPDLDGKRTTVSWLVVSPGSPKGEIGPDEEKRSVLLWAGALPGDEAPIDVVAIDTEAPSVTVAFADPLAAELGAKTARITLTGEKPAAAQQQDLDRRLVETATLVFDRLVLAPETAYVKAFIRKEFQAEVDEVEPVRGLAVPEILRPLYASLKGARDRLAVTAKGETVEKAPKDAARLHDLAAIIVAEAEQSLRYTAEEYKYRVGALQALSKKWREMEAALEFEGEGMRRIDFETRIAETPDAATRLRLARAYEQSFAPLYAEDSGYPRMIAKLNEIARKHGYENYAAMRVEEVFGVDAKAFRAWVEDAFAVTEAPAKEFIEELRAQKRAETGAKAGEPVDLGYWEVSHRKKAWLKKSLGVKELPRLSEEQARAILRRHLEDLGFDLAESPYDRITMDWYQDPLKQDASGVAATATPREAYFTSNLKPGQPIPLNEYETVVHETLHTIHYQTSGEASGGSSTWQNLMYSYIAEGITMSGESLPVATPALMKRYFGGLEGFTPKLMEQYPKVMQRAEAWDLRRLLVMAMMEMNLYDDRHEDGSERTWKERLAYWPDLIAKRLWVVPDGIELGQILCRMHPTAEQHQLMYASYPLGRILVGQLRDAVVKDGTTEELAAYGRVLRKLMARGALADQPYVKHLLAEVDGE